MSEFIKYVWRRLGHTRKFQIKDGINLRSIEKQRERMENIRLRSLSEMVGLAFDVAQPKPDSKPVVRWLFSGSRFRRLGEEIPIPDTALDTLGEIVKMVD
jgi:hypothetical protein